MAAPFVPDNDVPEPMRDRVRRLREDTSQLLDVTTDPRTVAALRMALEVFDDALLRLRIPLPGESDDT